LLRKSDSGSALAVRISAAFASTGVSEPFASDCAGAECNLQAITVPKGDPPSKLVIRDLKRGDGPEAAAGKTLAVDYKGVRFDDGEPFDSSWSTGQPFQFILGARQVIKGWEQGLEGMRVGGRRELIIPPELAYGDHGQGSIRPNETIVFVVDLLDVR